jgi:hypothetical protein
MNVTSGSMSASGWAHLVNYYRIENMNMTLRMNQKYEELIGNKISERNRYSSFSRDPSLIPWVNME